MLTTGSWLQVRKSWFWPAITVASFSSVGSARLPAATATSRGLSHACRRHDRFYEAWDTGCESASDHSEGPMMFA